MRLHELVEKTVLESLVMRDRGMRPVAVGIAHEDPMVEMVVEAGGALVALNVTSLYGLPVVIVPGLEWGEMRVLGCVREELDDE